MNRNGSLRRVYKMIHRHRSIELLALFCGQEIIQALSPSLFVLLHSYFIIVETTELVQF
jgi:hypothetical protein